MLVTVMEGYNLIVFGSVVPLLLADRSLRIDEQTTGLVGGVVYAGALIGVLGGTALARPVWPPPGHGPCRGSLRRRLGPGCAGPDPGIPQHGKAHTGIGVGGAVTTAMTLERNHAPRQRGSLAITITITMAGVPLGGSLAAVFGIFLMPLWGWRSMFWLGAGLTLVILALLLSFRVNEPAEVRQTTLTPTQKLTGLFRGRGWVLVLFVALAAVTNMLIWLGLNVWLAESMNALGFTGAFRPGGLRPAQGFIGGGPAQGEHAELLGAQRMPDFVREHFQGFLQQCAPGRVGKALGHLEPAAQVGGQARHAQQGPDRLVRIARLVLHAIPPLILVLHAPPPASPAPGRLKRGPKNCRGTARALAAG